MIFAYSLSNPNLKVRQCVTVVWPSNIDYTEFGQLAATHTLYMYKQLVTAYQNDHCVVLMIHLLQTKQN